jgi:hypothetical protein
LEITEQLTERTLDHLAALHKLGPEDGPSPAASFGPIGLS